MEFQSNTHLNRTLEILQVILIASAKQRLYNGSICPVLYVALAE